MSLNQLYQAIGISKQAVHQYARRQDVFNKELLELIVQADELREEHPGCGVEKMYRTLQPGFIGRDRFVELFMDLGYRVKRLKNYRKTTFPVSGQYENLIEGLLVMKEGIVWQSDITYIDLGSRFYYAVFIIDVYSRYIVGYQLSDNLRADANIRALKMALKTRQAPVIHHSDRGSQYIDKRYRKLLTDNGTSISMGLEARDNAYAERLNGTIKGEYIDRWHVSSFRGLKKALKKAVEHYNQKRVHDSLPGTTSPARFELNENRKEIAMLIHSKNRKFPVKSIDAFHRELGITKETLVCPLFN